MKMSGQTKLFSNILLNTEKQSAFFNRSYEARKISVISSILRPMSEKKALIFGKQNKSYYIDCDFNFTCIESQYLRIFINPPAPESEGTYGIFCTHYLFKCLYEEHIAASLSIPSVTKMMIVSQPTIITMRYKRRGQMYFVLHPDFGWVDVTKQYTTGDTPQKLIELINEDI